MEEKSTLDVSCALFSPRQVVIDLGAAPLDGEADWYTLTSHEESVQILVSQFDPIFNGQVTHLSVMCVCVCVCAEAGGIADARVGDVARGLCGPFVAAFDLVAPLRL